MKGGWSTGVEFSPCKSSTNYGKAETSVWLSQNFLVTFATDVKMGTDDHVPFYPALLNSLAGSLFTNVVLLLLV